MNIKSGSVHFFFNSSPFIVQVILWAGENTRKEETRMKKMFPLCIALLLIGTMTMGLTGCMDDAMSKKEPTATETKAAEPAPAVPAAPAAPAAEPAPAAPPAK
jgi:hypothetical protein